MSNALRLIRPLEKHLRGGHPWVYADALRGDANPGAWVELLDRKGKSLGWGIADGSPIGLRLWTLRKESFEDVLQRRLRQAFALRTHLPIGDTNAYRLVHGEGDRLPGIVVDRYDTYAVLRLDGEGIVKRRDAIIAALKVPLSELGITSLLVRRPRQESRGQEVKAELVYGDAPPRPLAVREHGMTLLVDLVAGQKTGLFLDHRESRRRLGEIARGKRVLNLYSYTGGFSIAAGMGGASRVHTVDIAPAAIELAKQSWEANGLDASKHIAEAQDVPKMLAEARGRWDLIVSDPPSFAPKSKAVDAATEAYNKLHASCLSKLADGGFYLAASCSSHIDGELFDATLREGAKRARKVVQILGRWGGAGDHPRLLAFPEGDYLKVVLCRLVG